MTGTSAEPSAPSAASRGTLDAEHVLSQLADGVIVADMQMRIVYANVAAAELLGWGDGELPGQDLVAVVPVRLRQRHRAGFLRYATTGERRLVGAGAVQLRALRRDGTEVDVDLTLGATEDSSGEALTVATLRDVSTRVALERRLAVTPYLEASLELAHVLQRSSTVDEGLRAALPALCRHLDWELAALWMPSLDEEALSCLEVWVAPGAPLDAFAAATRASSLVIDADLPGRAWEAGEPVVSTDLATVLTPERAAAAATVPRTGVAFPIVGGDRVLGVVELLTRTERPIDDELPPVLAGVGRQLGQFLIRMRSEEERASLADTLQRSLLPPHLPHPEGLQLAAAYRAGGTGVDVGGDFYDVFAVDASTWDVVVGDVCGKGAEAATTTALARYTLRAAAIHSDAPSEVLRLLDEVLRRDSGDTPFLTAVYVRLRREGDGFSGTVCCAGHPRPVLVAADGGVQAVGEPGSLLGVLADPDLVDVRLRLDAGDTLVLYTDGVIEARSSRGVPFGDDRLLALLAATYDRPLAQIPRLVEAAADDPGRQEPDDLAVLAVRVEAAAGDAGRTGDGTVEWLELPCDPGSTAQARRFAAAIVTRAGAAGALRTVELVVSELVANGVRHAHTPVTVGISADEHGVHLEVLDTGAGGARVVKPSQDAVSGRGLGLVATVAMRWGVEQRVPRGTRVWCELSAHADAHWAHRV